MGEADTFLFYTSCLRLGGLNDAFVFLIVYFLLAEPIMGVDWRPNVTSPVFSRSRLELSSSSSGFSTIPSSGMPEMFGLKEFSSESPSSSDVYNDSFDLESSRFSKPSSKESHEYLLPGFSNSLA